MLGNKIKLIRENNKISQLDLANKMGLKQCQISKIENGLRKVSINELTKLANALGVSISELLEDNKEAI